MRESMKLLIAGTVILGTVAIAGVTKARAEARAEQQRRERLAVTKAKLDQLTANAIRALEESLRPVAVPSAPSVAPVAPAVSIPADKKAQMEVSHTLVAEKIMTRVFSSEEMANQAIEKARQESKDL